MEPEGGVTCRGDMEMKREGGIQILEDGDRLFYKPSPPLGMLEGVRWLRAMHATAPNETSTPPGRFGTASPMQSSVPWAYA